MDKALLKKENLLKEKSKDSVEDFLEYILFEMSYPIEDYYLVIELLENKYSDIQDVRLAIIGAYLSSTWLSFKKNIFLDKLNALKQNCSEKDKAIIYYLFAYDMYMKGNYIDSLEYVSFLKKSIEYSKRFVYSYLRLAEVSDKKKSQILVEEAIGNVEKVWNESDLIKLPENYVQTYENFINEFILGVDISKAEYDQMQKI